MMTARTTMQAITIPAIAPPLNPESPSLEEAEGPGVGAVVGLLVAGMLLALRRRVRMRMRREERRGEERRGEARRGERREERRG
jgi:hypothetical protein